MSEPRISFLDVDKILMSSNTKKVSDSFIIGRMETFCNTQLSWM